jgi:hypothetical protein
MKKKEPKHPKDMTTDEALKHIFHPKIVRHIKALVKKHNANGKK